LARLEQLEQLARRMVWWNRPIIVIGWFGGLFWPFAYWDFVDYTFWPYAYDAFWPYAYDDLYVGVFGPYAYEGPVYTNRVRSSRYARRNGHQSPTVPVVCSAKASALTDWPIQQITELVQPDQAQQAALNDLKDATAKAVDALQAACPDDLPSTPTGRLAAMDKRIGTMLLALAVFRHDCGQRERAAGIRGCGSLVGLPSGAKGNGGFQRPDDRLREGLMS
jgi:hypothetical protein